MTIPDKGMLRNAIDLRRPYYEANMDRIKNFYGMNENKPKKSRDDFIFEAAQTLLTLLDHIGEDRLRGLLDGSMVVVPSQELDRSSTVERAAHNSRGCGFDSRRSDQGQEKPFPVIEFHQWDWMPGFAAFIDDTCETFNEKSKAFCVLNLGSFLASIRHGDVSKDELPYFMAECMMHEIIHVLEKWAGVEFSEDRVDALLEKYAATYKGNAPCHPEITALDAEIERGTQRDNADREDR